MPPPPSRSQRCADLYQPWTILRAHLAALRAVPRFSGCRFRLIVECNLSGQGSSICASALTELSDVDVVCSTNHAYGVFTTPGVKAVYFSHLRNLLRREALAFYETIVSACPFEASKSRQQLSTANMAKFEQQIRAFRYVYDVPRSLAGAVRATFTGKADHENRRSARMQDDMMMALGFGIKFAKDLLADPPFARLRTWITRLY